MHRNRKQKTTLVYWYYVHQVYILGEEIRIIKY